MSSKNGHHKPSPEEEERFGRVIKWSRAKRIIDSEIKKLAEPKPEKPEPPKGDEAA